MASSPFILRVAHDSLVHTPGPRRWITGVLLQEEARRKFTEEQTVKCITPLTFASLFVTQEAL
jgi:hypothetical protein